MLLLVLFLFFNQISNSLSEEWTVHVFTGSERFAGTDNNIFIRLYNSKHGFTNEYSLDHDNLIMGYDAMPIKNLFEYGGHDRFWITTGKFGYVETVFVRCDNFLLLQSDWFLSRIVIERNLDSKKFLFQCNCWIRRQTRNVTLSVSPDPKPIEKTVPLKTNSTIGVVVVVFIILIIFIGTIFCCIHKHCFRSQHKHFTRLEINQNISITERYNFQFHEPSAPPYINNQFENIQYSIQLNNDLESVDNQSMVTPTTDELPSYEDLFPDR